MSFIYLTSDAEIGQVKKVQVRKQLPYVAANIINGMKPLTIGRALGIGVRIVGRQIAQSAEAAANAQPQPTSQPVRNTPVQTARALQSQVKSANIAGGVGGLLRPFTRVGRVLWLEVMGAFFLLPVVAFSPNLWRMRASWAHGPDHNMFLLTSGIVLLFFYLGVSSFWRARQRSRQK